MSLFLRMDGGDLCGDRRTFGSTIEKLDGGLLVTPDDMDARSDGSNSSFFFGDILYAM